jgi:dTMP kinase
MNEGVFISFEGGEGSGKTIQTRVLAERLRGIGLRVNETREPGGTLISEQIRNVLTKPENAEMLPRTEFLLFQASRAQLTGQMIKPRLDEGNIVVIDRYADSTLAYQGYGHGLDLNLIRTIVNFATNGLMPDLTLLLDLEVNVGLRRRELAGGINRLDLYPIDFHERVRSGYLEMAREDPARWKVIDATPQLTEVAETVWLEVDSYLKAVGMLGLV